VQVVCVLDPQSETAHVFFSDRPVEQLTGDRDLTFPGILDDFSIPVRRFFE
jgi:hypothetical protein